MAFGHAPRPGGSGGSAHSSVASCRTVAGSLMVNPAGSTSRTCRPGGRVDRRNVIRVSADTARHSAVALADPAPIITPPGFTPLTDGWAVAAAPAAGAVPDAAVPVPATVVPQAASPIMSPAAMPPSATRPAAPSGLPSVLIATPSEPGAAGPRPAVSPALAPVGRIPEPEPPAPGRPRAPRAGRARPATAHL